ncbi:MAG: hypothetical protein FWB76_02530 [Oscillospiraceae bacterium]|nr:hypothetical protein [Oscillospiraceae bacterium]
MKTCILASNWGAYFFPWAQSERLHIRPPTVLDEPATLAQYDKIIALNGIGDHWLLHPNLAAHHSFFFLWDMARCPHYAPSPALLQRLKRLHKCYSFQHDDCRDFGLHFNSTMYAPPRNPPLSLRDISPRGGDPGDSRNLDGNAKGSPTGGAGDAIAATEGVKPFDVLFLGVPKDRLPQLRHLHEQLQRMGLRTHFRLAITPHDSVQPEQRPGWCVTREWMTYPNYIALVQQSRCLLDIYQAGQTGFSLRVMEHVYFGCKLITNNAAIKHADFYHPHNIFLLGEDNMAALPAWLNLPFVPIDNDIQRYYHIEEWAKRFT